MKAVLLLGIDPETYPENAVSTVRSLASDYEIVVTTDRDEIEGVIDRVEIALAHIPRDLMATAPSLKWYQQVGAGADWLDRYPDIVDAEFTITNASGVHAVPISEHMLAFLLSAARGFPSSIRGQREKIWSENRKQNLFELADKRCLLLGVGAIGERFARLAAACDMEVIGLRRDPSKPAEGVRRMVGPDALRDELPQADVVANTLPLTPETRHIIGRAEIEIMKPGSYIVNIGRGGTIDEAAMIDALKSGHLAGAGLDVFEEEPLPESSPLWEMDNVIITPHYSGLTPRYNERVFDIFCRNLERYLAGDELLNVVDRKLRY